MNTRFYENGVYVITGREPETRYKVRITWKFSDTISFSGYALDNNTGKDRQFTLTEAAELFKNAAKQPGFLAADIEAI